MAKFKQYKLPDGTVLLCKDEIAGKTLNLTSDKMLQLLDEAGTVRSQVQLPFDKCEILDGGVTLRQGGLHKIPNGASKDIIYIEKFLYLVNKETGELISTLALVDDTKTQLNGLHMQAPSYASSVTINAGAVSSNFNTIPYLDGVSYWVIEIYFPNSDAAKTSLFTGGTVTINNEKLRVEYFDPNDPSHGVILNGTTSAKTIAPSDEFPALYDMTVPSLVKTIEKTGEQFIYDVWDSYNQWAPQFSWFKFNVGGLGSHIVTSIEVDLWDDATQEWISKTPVAYTQDPDTEQVSFTITAGNNDYSDMNRDYLRLTVHTADGTSSLKLSPNAKIYT